MSLALGKDLRRHLRCLLCSLCLLPVCAGLLVSPVGAAAAVGTQISPAPRLPNLPAVPSSLAPRDHGVSIPASATAAGGTWVLGNGERMPVARTVVTLPPAGGTALLADWNGDGLATPGRYEDGRWYVTNATVGAQEWQSLATFGKAG
ncbi:MAG: hypothetical protein ACKOW5_17410, partial [Actinomycetales bacterium]